MADDTFTDYGETPTIEVRVLRDGALIDRQLVESDDEAALVVEWWSEHDGVTCEVDDLSSARRSPGVLEPQADADDMVESDFADDR